MSTRKIRNWWWVDFRVNYTRYRLRSPENTQPGAKSYEAVLRRRLAAGEPLRPVPPASPAITFGEFSAEWFATYVKTNCKPSSQRSREHILRIHLLPWFGSIRLTDMTTSRVEAYKAAKIREGLSPKTVNDHLGVLGKCLRDARNWDRPAANPKLKALRVQDPPIEVLRHEEADRLLSAMNSNRWRAMATVALHTGLRRGELFGLRWSDVDLENANLMVRQSIVEGIAGPPKSNRERSVALDQVAVAALASMPRTHELVFHRGNGQPLTCSTAQGALTRACRRAKLRNIGWHTFRHTFASWLVSAKVPLPYVQALLGHSTIEMTMRYVHFASSALHEAVDALNPVRPVALESAWAPGGQRLPFPPFPAELARIA